MWLVTSSMTAEESWWRLVGALWWSQDSVEGRWKVRPSRRLNHLAATLGPMTEASLPSHLHSRQILESQLRLSAKTCSDTSSQNLDTLKVSL